MATTSSNLVAGKALAGHGSNGNNGRYGLKAKVMAGIAVLGCAAALAFGGLKSADNTTSQSQPAAVPGNAALAQTQAGSGYLEFSPSDVSNIANPPSVAPNVAWTRSQAGTGFLEFQTGDGVVVDTGTSNATVGIGLREYLDGEIPAVSPPLSSPTTQPMPEFGPQP